MVPPVYQRSRSSPDRCDGCERSVGREQLGVADDTGSWWRFTSVFDFDQQPQLRQATAHGGDPLAERAVIDEHFGVGVLEERSQLGGFVAEVDVRRERAQLRAREQAFDVLGTVEQIERDVSALRHAPSRETRREPGGVVFQLLPVHPPITLHDGGRIGDGVGDGLPHGGKALVHGDAAPRYRVALLIFATSATVPSRVSCCNPLGRPFKYAEKKSSVVSSTTWNAALPDFSNAVL